ncbi:MAG: hypothetical protein MRY76_00035, partial [Pseudomonadales bacterium]|nr:hypothetical protein [Pseudomonadales bacterium]
TIVRQAENLIITDLNQFFLSRFLFSADLVKTLRASLSHPLLAANCLTAKVNHFERSIKAICNVESTTSEQRFRPETGARFGLLDWSGFASREIHVACQRCGILQAVTDPLREKAIFPR